MISNSGVGLLGSSDQDCTACMLSPNPRHPPVILDQAKSEAYGEEMKPSHKPIMNSCDFPYL